MLKEYDHDESNSGATKENRSASEEGSATERQDVLCLNRLSTQRTFGFLPDPVGDALPAEHMSTRGGTWIFKLFKTQSAFSLLLSLNPTEC